MKKNSGEGYIDTVVSLMAFIMLAVVFINIFTIIIENEKLEYITSEVLACATANGSTGEISEARFTELCGETGSSPDISYEGTEYFKEKCVQLGEKICVTVSENYNIRGFGAVSFSIKLVKTGSGLSEKYWKK